MRRPAVVAEARDAGKRGPQQVVDHAHDPLLVGAQQPAVGAHRDLDAAAGDADRERDRGLLDPQQLGRDLRDHVAVGVAHEPDRRDAHLARHLLVAERRRAVGVPLRRHAVVAQLVQDVLRLLRAREQLEHLEVERRRAVEQSARVGVDAERRRGLLGGAQAVEHVEHRRQHGHERRGGADGEPDERQPHALDALGAAVLLHLGRIRVVVGHEEVVAHRLDFGRRQHPERRRAVDHAVQPALQAVTVRVLQRDAAALDQLAVLRMPQAAGEDPHLLGAELAQDRRQQHGAAERVRVPHPLREDVGAAPADRLGAALQAAVRRVGLRQHRQDLERAALAQQPGETAPNDRGPRGARRQQHVSVALHPRCFPSRVSVASGMERPALPGQVDEQGRGLEAQPLHRLEREARTEAVEVPERPAQERRKSEAEDGPHVPVPRRAQDAFLQAANHLVQEREHQPLLGLVRVDRAPRGAVRQYRVDRLVHALPAAVVAVEAAGGLPALAPVAEQGGHRRRRRHALAERALHDARDTRRHVDADLVEQRAGPDRKAEVGHRAVERVDRGALLQHARRFVHVRGERAARVEAGPVPHHDHVLSHAPAEAGRGRHRERLGLGCHHHFEQRHLRHRREEVHAQHAPRPPAALRDLADRDRRGVAREHGGLRDHALDLGQHAPLQLQVLEHRLDHQVGASEAAEVEARRDPVHALAHLAQRQASALAALVVDAARLLEPAPERLERGVLDRTATPASAATHAIPEPISPAPSTPSLRTSRGGVPSGTPVSFLMSCVAKKTETSARDSALTESRPKAPASSANPSARLAAVPFSTTSSATSGAG